MLIPVVVAVAIVIFTLMYFVPGDPAEIILGGQVTQEQKDALYEQLGLDQPYIVQLGRYLYDTFIRLDLGSSWINSKSVSEELFSRLPKTMIFAIAAMVIQVVLGVHQGFLFLTE